MGCDVVLSGPPTLMPREIEQLGVKYDRDPRKAVEKADMVYLLEDTAREAAGRPLPLGRRVPPLVGADEELMKYANPGALAMHPGPINRGVEIASEVADGHQSVILEQVRSGVATRMALLISAAEVQDNGKVSLQRF
ncbi:MAG: hypothetical protein ACLUEQ_06560 [Cloacibacillus evryensis]